MCSLVWVRCRDQLLGADLLQKHRLVITTIMHLDESAAEGQHMSNFLRQFSQLTHIVLLAFLGLPWCVVCYPWLVFANEQEVSHSASSACEIELSVTGKLKFPVGSDLRSESLEIVTQPVHAHSNLTYRQKVNPDESELGPTAVRHYEHAVAKVVIGGDCVNTQLPRGVTDIHVCAHEKGLEFWFREGFLTQSEADLLTVAFDPLYLRALVPPNNQACGMQWELNQAVITDLLCIDTIRSGGLKATIKDCTDEGTAVQIQGNIKGAVNGAATSITVEGDYDWTMEDNAAGGVSMLHVVIKESRDVSYMAPGIDIEAVIEMSCRSQKTLRPRVVAASSSGMSKYGRSRRGPGKPGFRWTCDPYDRYDVVYENNWKIIEEGSEYLMMRFVDQGALVGQVTLTPLPLQSKVLTLSDFENDIEQTLGEQFGHLVSASTFSRDDGTTIMRVASVGESEDLPFHWIHYHLRSIEGRRLSLAFVVESRHLARFSEADRQYIEGVDLAPE